MEALHQPGDVVGDRYRILSLLGQGGMGTTYTAEDRTTQQKVAIKVVSLRQISEWKVLDLFERETRVLETLHHPGIPRYIGHFQEDLPGDRRFYLVQELAEGHSLATLVNKGWRTAEADVKRIATRVLEILVYLHTLSPPVIHRDIKPQNIICCEDGRVFLVDFGAVQEVYQHTVIRSSTFVGTMGYAPPEQYRGQVQPTADLYSLGATLVFVLTHQSPDRLPQKRLKLDFRSQVSLSPGFADWLDRMLEPAVEDRFQSAAEALAALTRPPVPTRSRQSGVWDSLTDRYQVVLRRGLDEEIVNIVGSTRPNGSAIAISRYREELEIIVPGQPPGCGSLFLMIFAFLMVGSVPIGTFISYMIVRHLLWPGLREERLRMTPEGFELRRSLFGVNLVQQCGRTELVRRVELEATPNRKNRMALVFWDALNKRTLGEGKSLDYLEYQWMATELLSYLDDIEVLEQE